MHVQSWALLCIAKLSEQLAAIPLQLSFEDSVWQVQAAEQAAEGNKIFEKIKDALPFGTLPVFDLAELSKDDADMGPNEVNKEYLATGFQNSNNPFDTAMPGAEPSMHTWLAWVMMASSQCVHGNVLCPQVAQARPLGQTSPARTMQAQWMLAQQLRR